MSARDNPGVEIDSTPGFSGVKPTLFELSTEIQPDPILFTNVNRFETQSIATTLIASSHHIQQ
jgi:hypothetical protein